MKYYPVNLDINNRNCLVVGGGRVGERKIETLLKCGAIVTVVSIDVTKRILSLSEKKAINLKQRPYRSSDIENMFLVIGATDDETLNRRIHTDAESINALCNIADRPRICNFILPSIVQRGDLVISISTSGKSPAFAKKLRKDLENEFGGEYAVFLQLMGAIRKKLLAEKHEPETHKPIFEKIIEENLVHMIAAEETEKIDALFEQVLGPEYTYGDLMGKDL